jgi:hypothetical protein
MNTRVYTRINMYEHVQTCKNAYIRVNISSIF